MISTVVGGEANIRLPGFDDDDDDDDSTGGACGCGAGFRSGGGNENDLLAARIFLSVNQSVQSDRPMCMCDCSLQQVACVIRVCNYVECRYIVSN